MSETSKDVNCLSMKAIKYLMHVIWKLYTYICNLSLASGVIPDDFKTAKVLPLF